MKITDISEGKSQEFCTEILNTTTFAECSAEVSMPDYYPEIRRVVAYYAKALPDSKFLSEGKLEYGGSVSFSVLYIGDDGSLCSVPYNDEYTGEVPLSKEIAGTDKVRITTQTENLQCRVTAPRKLSLKTKLRSQIVADGREEYGLSVENADGERLPTESFEFLDKINKTVFRRWVSQTGSIEGEFKASGEVKPVMCTGDVSVISATAQSDSVTVKGIFNVQCIALNSEGLYSATSEEYPFEETVTVDGVSDKDIAAAYGRAASVSINFQGDKPTLQAEYDLDVTVCRKKEVVTTEDLYSTEAIPEIVRETFEPLSLAALSNGQFSLGGEVKKKGDGYLVCAMAEPTFEKTEIKEGKLIVCGNCKLKAYIAGDGDVTSEESNVPIRYEIPSESNSVSPDIAANVQMSVMKLSAKDAGDKININTEIGIMTEAVEKYRIEPVVKAIVKENEMSANPGCIIKICCPEEGMPIWNIAKKYRASMTELEKINGVRKDGVSDGKPLIVKL